MKVRLATLCDAASIREGLLNILGAGITQMYRPEYPAPLQVTYAALVEFTAREARAGATLRLRIVDEDGEMATEPPVDGVMQFPTETGVGEDVTVSLPFVVDAKDVLVNEPGPVYFVLDLDDEEADRLQVRAVATLPEEWQPPTPS